MSLGFTKSEELFEEAKKIIPGGVTSARHPTKFVLGKYPIFMNRGKGSHVWDVDGNEYIDWIVSFGPVILGHCNPEVDNAVRKNLEQGFCFTMVHPLQNDLAKELIRIIPCAEMAKFFTGGSDATSAAIRIARVYTGKDKVIRWGYHGWHDWCYGGAGTDREVVVGVPEGIKKDILTFTYNDLNSLEDVFRKNKNKVACVIMQPYEASKEFPKEGFLKGVKEITHENGAVLIYDEIRSGFRMAIGGAQEYFGVIPDVAAVSKAMANGYPISAVVGKREVMQEAAKTRLSATFFVNSFPMAAALATINVLKKRNGVEYMWTLGKKLMQGLTEIVEDEDVKAEVIGVPPLPMLKFTDKNEPMRDKLKNAFYTETTKRGILFHPNHCWFLSLAHTEEDINKTLEVSRESMKIAKKECGL
jgi:glutamate-1-semialdehyde 2,1-aminomutase/spore coat polysaccharide biosynthesis protein SpsF